MPLQNISEQFLDFIQEQDINVPEDFIQIFYASISLDQWISSEFASKYLEYSRQDVFIKTLKKFMIDQDYKKITKEQNDEIRSTLTCERNKNLNNIKKEKPQSSMIGGQNKKYYLLSPDCFKTMLLIRDSQKGKQYRAYMITLEKIFKEFMIYLQNKQDDQIKNQIKNQNEIIEKKNKQLQRKEKKLIQSYQQIHQLEQDHQEQLIEMDNQVFQLEDEIEQLNNQIAQQQHRYQVLSIYKENIDEPQIICYTSNIQETLLRNKRLLNKYFNQKFDYYYHVIQQDLTRQQAIQLKQETILRLTGQERTQHYNLQIIVPLFE